MTMLLYQSPLIKIVAASLIALKIFSSKISPLGLVLDSQLEQFLPEVKLTVLETLLLEMLSWKNRSKEFTWKLIQVTMVTAL